MTPPCLLVLCARASVCVCVPTVSDTLVGILMRGRKRKNLGFESDMLFQGVHDNVVISVFKGV